MEYQARRQAIEQLVTKNIIKNQQELIKLLNQQGYTVTQATVSRDLEELSIVKVHDHQVGTHYAKLELQVTRDQWRLIQMIKQWVESVTTVKFMNVVKTTPNSNFATIVAGEFDTHPNEKLIVGTLAGNDTLIIISPNEIAANTVKNFIQQYLTTK
ncbi:arginine repressor [Limosilactobacillus equigenerosi]|uniref:Arginine repressor n=1 Tax=Limosilactobacillus equigenerosi DSM 18793 = JCM 14505 TaxID=1423742 RepID=A0A0R1USH1_9LACO|nr:arginine repressor [Limosilactobacillus equigenerosi]KRL96071.1 Arginine repressor [Limosilactobacillus equigenerosi DSM 18793 = JCM 14505]